VDALAALPQDLLVWAAAAASSAPPPWPFMAWARATKLLRARRLPHAQPPATSHYGNGRPQSSGLGGLLARLSLRVFILLHYLACIAWLIGRASRDVSTGGEAWFSSYVGLHKMDIYAQARGLSDVGVVTCWVVHGQPAIMTALTVLGCGKPPLQASIEGAERSIAVSPRSHRVPCGTST